MRALIIGVLAFALAGDVLAVPSQEVFYRRRGASTTIQFSNQLITTGVITTGATFTLTCGCIAEAGTLALGACNAGTTAAEIGTTGVWNLTVNLADIANDYCFVKAVAGTIANSPDHLFEIRTREQYSALDVTNPSGTAVTFASTGSNGAAISATGNGSGQGMLLTGGASGAGMKVLNGGGAPALHVESSGAQDTFYIKTVGGVGLNVVNAGGTAAAKFSSTAGNAPGVQIIGNGTGAGIISTGGATGNALTLTGGATSGAALAATNTTGDVMTVTAAAGNGDAIQLTPHGTGVGINGTLATVNSVATGGITAASIAADAITSSEIATSAATEIASASGSHQRVE